MKKLSIPARLFRAGQIEREPPPGEGGEDDRRVRLSFSSEAPVERWFGLEILGHRDGEVNLARLASGALPLLLDHRATIDSQVGTVESVEVVEGRGTAIVRFGRGARAQEVLDRVRDGEITGVSVGYSIDDAEYIGSTPDDLPIIRVTRWSLLEISLVSIPADPSVGIGRSAPGAVTLTLSERKADMTAEEIAALAASQAAAARAAATVPAAAATPAAPAPIDAAAQVRADRARARDITVTGKRFNLPQADIDSAIDSGMSLEAFGQRVLSHMASDDQVEFRSEGAKVGLTEKEVKRYSVMNAIRYLADPNDRNARRAAAFEIEVGAAAAERAHSAPKGLLIPADILSRADYAPQTRAANQLAGTPAAGGNLIGTDLLSGSFIDLLRKRSAILRANVMMLGGLSGNVAIPKQTGGATAYWVGEDTAPTGSGATFGQVPLSPKTVGAFTEISRRLMIQSSLDVEALVRRDLATVIALAVDSVALNGSADVDAPNGLADVAGINAVDFAAAGAPTFAEVVDMETQIAADDADVAAMSYIFNAGMRGYLKTRPIEAGNPARIMDGNTVNGYPAIVSNQALTGEMWFGNFADFIVGMWSGLDLTVDPYSASTTGAVRVIAFQDVDFAVRNAASFCLGKMVP